VNNFSFFLFVFLVLSESTLASKKFQLRFVRAESSEKKVNLNITKELDHKMISSKAFCPAHSFAKRVGNWACEKKKECRARYKCHFITKENDRKSALIQNGKRPVVKTPYKVYVTKRPLIVLGKKLKKSKKRLKKKLSDDSLEKSSLTAVVEKNENSVEASQILEDKLLESASKDKVIKATNSDEKVSNSSFRSFRPMMFSLQVVKGSLETFGQDESLGPSFGLRYQPHYYISQNFAIAGDFSWHKFSLKDENSVSVLGFGAFAKYFANQNIYGVLGLGKESFSFKESNLEKTNFTRINYGLGYKFSRKAFSFLESVEFVAASLKGETEGVNASYFKLSFNLSFH